MAYPDAKVEDGCCIIQVPKSQPSRLARDQLASFVPVMRFEVCPELYKNWRTCLYGQDITDTQINFAGDVDPSQPCYQSVVLQFELAQSWQWYGQGIYLQKVLNGKTKDKHDDSKAGGLGQKLGLDNAFSLQTEKLSPSLMQLTLEFSKEVALQSEIYFRYQAVQGELVPGQLAQVHYSQDPRIVVGKPKGGD